MSRHLEVEHVTASNGAQIYRIPLEVFPNYYAYSHLIADHGRLFLVDVGSGFGSSHADLIKGLELITEQSGLPARPDKLDFVVITHGHIDHFGGLALVKQAAPQAKVAIHELARPVLVNYDERVLVTSQRMGLFLERAGVPEERRKHLLELHMLGKRAFKPQHVDFTLADGEVFEQTLRVIHVPGHEPGLVMLLVGDVLLTADHVLPVTSVALAPETIMPFTGVAHYVDSLDKAARVEGVRMALGGHERSMPEYYDVVRRTHSAVLEKVERVHDACGEPRTIYELASLIYEALDGYGELLKLGQIGARIEYLNQRGSVMIDNLDALEKSPNPVLYYRKV